MSTAIMAIHQKLDQCESSPRRSHKHPLMSWEIPFDHKLEHSDPLLILRFSLNNVAAYDRASRIAASRSRPFFAEIRRSARMSRRLNVASLTGSRVHRGANHHSTPAEMCNDYSCVRRAFGTGEHRGVVLPGTTSYSLQRRVSRFNVGQFTSTSG